MMDRETCGPITTSGGADKIKRLFPMDAFLGGRNQLCRYIKFVMLVWKMNPS